MVDTDTSILSSSPVCPGNRPEPAWATALRRLHANGWPDARIAEALSRLSDRDILLLEKHDLWDYRNVESAFREGAGSRQWSRYQVKRARWKLGLAAVPRKFECGTLQESRLTAARVFASHQGWGHLVGRSEELNDLIHRLPSLDLVAAEAGWPVELVRGWCLSSWDVLWPSEVMVLSALDLYGSLTLTAIQACAAGIAEKFDRQQPHLKHAGLDDWGRRQSLMWRLCERGLCRVTDLRTAKGRSGRPSTVYDLAGGIQRHERTPFSTRLERMTKKMKWG